MFEELNAHRQAVRENIEKAFEIGFTGNDSLEKAHQVGDIHPNGKWVWTQLPSGKYDWRVIKKKDGGNSKTAKTDAKPTTNKQDNIEVGKIYVGKFDGDTIEYEIKEKRGGGYQLISYTYGKDEDESGNPKKYTDIQEETKTLEDMVNKIKEGKYFDLNATDNAKPTTQQKTVQNGKKEGVSDSANHSSLSGLKGVSNMKEYLTTFNSKYTDMSKVKVMRTPKGNWDVHYDGHRLGIFAGNQVPESTAKKMGWLRTDSSDLTRSKRDAGREEKKESTGVNALKYESKNGFKFKKSGHYTMRYNQREKAYEIWEKGDIYGAKIAMMQIKSENENIGMDIIKHMKEKYSKGGSGSITYSNTTYAF